MQSLFKQLIMAESKYAKCRLKFHIGWLNRECRIIRENICTQNAKSFPWPYFIINAER
jgi:hypothetical protein